MTTNVRVRALIGLVSALAAGCGGPDKPAEPPGGATPPAPTAEPTAQPTAEPAATEAPPSTEAPPAASAAPASPPVAAGLLKGTVKGKPFTPRAALVYADPSGDKQRKKISIFDAPVACKDRDKLEGKGRREVSAIVKWAANTSVDLDAFSAGIFIDEKGTPIQIGNLAGRVELGEAPDKPNSKGKMKVRVNDQAGENKVEGEIVFVVCE